MSGYEFFTLHPGLFEDKFGLQFNALGYCSVKRGYCGSSVPIYRQDLNEKLGGKFSRPLCYGFSVDRDLDGELELHKPFRYAQIANRIEPIFATYYPENFNTHYHRVANRGERQKNQVFQLVNPLHIEQLSYYCAKLIPLYRVVDYINDNSILVVNQTQLDYYRQHRNRYEEEELLGYCSNKLNYCGASLQINHFEVYHEYSHKIDDVYLPQETKDQKCMDCDQYNYQNILCYGF